MKEKEYQESMLFMGILSTKGFPSHLEARLEEAFGSIAYISESFPFSFTDYYEREMGKGIERFFIAFDRLVKPDQLALIKTLTNSIESEWDDNGRKINLDPGLISEANVVLATTKNRSHRIAIGLNLYAEVTLICQKHGFVSFDWTYADYRSPQVQEILLQMRSLFLKKRNLVRP